MAIADKDGEQRESIWSVKSQDRYRFSYWFATLFCAGLIFVVWYEIWHVEENDLFKKIFNLMKDVGIVGLLAVTLAFFRFEGRDAMGVALEIFHQKRFEDGRKAAQEAAREAVLAWYKSEIAKGNTFSELPPFLRDQEENGKEKEE